MNIIPLPKQHIRMLLVLLSKHRMGGSCFEICYWVIVVYLPGISVATPVCNPRKGRTKFTTSGAYDVSNSYKSEKSFPDENKRM